jgi:hypothetical protein
LRGLSRLTVNDRGCWLVLAPIRFPHFAHQLVVDHLPETIAIPESSMMVSRLPRAQLVANSVPLTTFLVEEAEPIENLPERRLSRTSAVGLPLGHHRLEDFPLCIGQIAGIRGAHAHLLRVVN